MSTKNQIEDLADAGLLKIATDRIDGREVFSADKRYIDYCNTNYLGLDFDEHMVKKGIEYAKKWGSLTGWSRLEADPTIYSQLEDRISKFIGVKETILSHTITITNFSSMPYIAQKGVIFVDSQVHAVCYEAARLARDHGAEIVKFQHQDVKDLQDKLEKFKSRSPKIILVDGVYSISTERAPILEIQHLCEKFDAWLYVDDAHGFGVLGQNPSSQQPYGVTGNGLVNFAGGNFRRTFYVASFGKAFCTHTAFITVPSEFEGKLRENCMQYIYSAPMAPYTIGNVDASMDLNESIGESRREALHGLTKSFVDSLEALDVKVVCQDYFPVVYWEIGDVDALIEIAKELYAAGIIAGLRPYPLVPKDKCGMRFGLTCLHTEAQIAESVQVIGRLVSKMRSKIKSRD